MIPFLFNWFVKITGFLAYAVVFRPEYHYEDKTRQSRRIKGASIIVSNHVSIWDVAIVLFAFPFNTLRCAVAELMYRKNFVFTAFLRLFGTIRVDRESQDLSFLEDCEKVLSKGGVIEIYPESRLSKLGEERPLPFKPSAVLLALRSGAPIIPIYHDSTYFNKGKTAVMIGAPIDVREMYDDTLTEKENVKRITEAVRRKVIELGEKLKENKK